MLNSAHSSVLRGIGTNELLLKGALSNHNESFGQNCNNQSMLNACLSSKLLTL